MWMVHVSQFEHIARVDNVMIWLNNGRLLMIVLVPFSTGITTEYSEYYAGRIMLAANFFLAIVFSFLQWRWAVRHREQIMPDLSHEDAVAYGRGNLSALILSGSSSCSRRSSARSRSPCSCCDGVADPAPARQRRRLTRRVTPSPRSGVPWRACAGTSTPSTTSSRRRPPTRCTPRLCSTSARSRARPSRPRPTRRRSTAPCTRSRTSPRTSSRTSSR